MLPFNCSYSGYSHLLNIPLHASYRRLLNIIRAWTRLLDWACSVTCPSRLLVQLSAIFALNLRHGFPMLRANLTAQKWILRRRKSKAGIALPSWFRMSQKIWAQSIIVVRKNKKPKTLHTHARALALSQNIWAQSITAARKNKKPKTHARKGAGFVPIVRKASRHGAFDRVSTSKRARHGV